MKVGVVVQRLEHRPVTAEVAGSNPVNLVIIFYCTSSTSKNEFLHVVPPVGKFKKQHQRSTNFFKILIL